MVQQLSLDVSLKDEATFDNFYPSGNETALEAMIQVVSSDRESFLFLWGSSGVGRTHLLHACAHEFPKSNQTLMYLPFADRDYFSHDILLGMENLDLIVLDDIHLICGDAL